MLLIFPTWHSIGKETLKFFKERQAGIFLWTSPAKPFFHSRERIKWKCHPLYSEEGLVEFKILLPWRDTSSGVTGSSVTDRVRLLLAIARSAMIYNIVKIYYRWGSPSVSHYLNGQRNNPQNSQMKPFLKETVPFKDAVFLTSKNMARNQNSKGKTHSFNMYNLSICLFSQK